MTDDLVLTNFRLPMEGNVELEAFGRNWDLHNFADFLGMRFEPVANELTLEWRVPAGASNPWGDPSNRARGCRLVFRGVRTLVVDERDPELPPSESSCVATLWSSASGRPGMFELELQDGRSITVGASSAELVPVD